MKCISVMYTDCSLAIYDLSSASSRQHSFIHPAILSSMSMLSFIFVIVCGLF